VRCLIVVQLPESTANYFMSGDFVMKKQVDEQHRS
jgi:hypothetical protein